jgi:hypothetical protein
MPNRENVDRNNEPGGAGSSKSGIILSGEINIFLGTKRVDLALGEGTLFSALRNIQLDSVKYPLDSSFIKKENGNIRANIEADHEGNRVSIARKYID